MTTTLIHERLSAPSVPAPNLESDRARPTKVAIIESQRLFSKALSLILSSDPELQVVCDAPSIEDAMLATRRPDVVIIDIEHSTSQRYSVMDVAALVQQCRKELPNVAVCMLSGRSEPELMHRCLSAGANGYIMKDIIPQEFRQALKIVAKGEPYVDARLAGGILRRRTLNVANNICELSRREIEIVTLIARGLSNRGIGAHLSLSEQTIKNHVSRIFSKLNISARSQAAAYAIRSGFA